MMVCIESTHALRVCTDRVMYSVHASFLILYQDLCGEISQKKDGFVAFLNKIHIIFGSRPTVNLPQNSVELLPGFHAHGAVNCHT